MNRPVVAHLLPPYNAFPPVIPAGTELRVEQAGLRHQRYQPLVVCGHFPGQCECERIDALEIRRIRFSRLYRRLFQKITRLDPYPYGERIWRIIQAEGAAVLHIHNEPKLLSGLAGRLRHAPMPVVVHIANQKPFHHEDLSLVTRFVACSRFMADWLIATYGIEPGKVEVIHTGVDVSGRPPIWALPSERRQALRAGYGIDDANTIVFVFGGRLVQEKGVAELLDAFALLRERSDFPVQLLVAGNVRDSKDPKNVKATYGRAMIERMADMPGVTWVGSLKPSAMHDFLTAGDVFMLPSLWDDPYPTVMLEAAAAGLPIVAASRGGMTEFLQGCPDFDFVDDPSNKEELATAMMTFGRSFVSRDRAGRWLRDKIENQFDWSRVAADFEALYDRLLASLP